MLIMSIILILIVSILFSRLKISIKGIYNENKFDGSIEFKIFNLRIFSKKLGKNDKKNNSVFSVFKNRDKFYRCLKNYRMLLFETKAGIGLDDAALTAIFTGILYSIMSWIYAILNYYIDIDKVNFNVVPDFSQIRFEFNFECIIEVKVVHIIIDVLHVWVIFIREKIKNSERESLYG